MDMSQENENLKRKTFTQILEENSLDADKEGLGSLLGEKAKVTLRSPGAPLSPQDVAKQKKIQETLDQLIHIPEKLEEFEKKLSQKEPQEGSSKGLILIAVIAAFTLIAGLITLKQLKEVKEAPKEVMTEVKPIEVIKHFVVTSKFVNLRSTNSPKAKVLETLPPNTKLEKLGEKRGWIKIQYDNYLEERTVQGWVWKEFIKDI